MNKKIVRGSLAGVAVIALAAGGGTFAAWSDFNSITGNNAGAGVMKLNVGPNGQGADLLFDHVTMAPGSINQERTVYVASNDGASTPSGRLYMSVKDLVGTENGCDSNGETADDPDCVTTTNGGDFIDDATVTFSSYAVDSPGACTPGYAPANKVVTRTHGGSLKTLANEAAWEVTGDGRTIVSGTGANAVHGVNRSYLAPGQGLCVSIDISMWDGLDNASQGDKASFTTRFDLKQAPYGTPTTPLTP
jgi:predicted ribosomally synthesized peptide with SipW-like signal peptide